MTTEKFKHLENILKESDDFSEIFDYFLTNFAEQPAFTQQSKKFKSPLIKELVSQASAQIFNKIPIQITNLLLLNHERFGIIHGAGWVEAKLFNVFYCKRINKGLLVITTGKSTEMARITPTPAKPTEQLGEDFIESVEEFSKHFKHQFPN